MLLEREKTASAYSSVTIVDVVVLLDVAVFCTVKVSVVVLSRKLEQNEPTRKPGKESRNALTIFARGLQVLGAACLSMPGSPKVVVKKLTTHR